MATHAQIAQWDTSCGGYVSVHPDGSAQIVCICGDEGHDVEAVFDPATQEITEDCPNPLRWGMDGHLIK